MSSAAQSLARSQAVYRQYYGKEAQPYALPREISVEELDFLTRVYLESHPDAVRTRLLVDAAQNDYEAVVGQQRGALNFQASMSQTKNPGSSNFLDDRTPTLILSKLAVVEGRTAPRHSRRSCLFTGYILIFNVTYVMRSPSTRENSPGYRHVSS